MASTHRPWVVPRPDSPLLPARPRKRAVILRALATWAVLFSSKFVILETVDIVFGDDVDLCGLVPFIILTIALLTAETILTRIYDALA